MFVGDSGEIQLEGEALLEPVRALDVDRVDAVERFLRGADHHGALHRDVVRDPHRGVAKLSVRHNLQHRPEVMQLLRGDRGCGVHHRPHPVLRHEPRKMGGCAQRTAIHFRQPERCVVARDHDVCVADEAHAATETEPVDRGDHRHRTFVDGGEGRETPPVRADEGVEAFGVLHLLDVDTGVEAPALGSQHHHVDRGILARGPQDGGQLEPTGHGQGVDRRVVHDDLGDAGVVDGQGRRHGQVRGRRAGF